MAQHGGTRPGAGRPKGHKAAHTLEASIAKQKMVEMISARTEELVNKLFEKAIEHGDTAAIKELLDRGFGKPQQSTDVTTGGDKLTTLMVRFLDGDADTN